MEEKRWTLEHHTWQGRGGDRQVLEMTGLADRLLSSGLFIATPSCRLLPSPSVPTPSIKVIRYCFFPLSLEGAYHPASRISETQPGGACIRCQKWDSAYILPLTVSGTLGKTHLLSVFPNAPGRGWLDQ